MGWSYVYSIWQQYSITLTESFIKLYGLTGRWHQSKLDIAKPGDVYD